MSDRPISADDLIERAYRLRLDDREQIVQMIASAPTVDAIPVVRCKDCKWYKESKHSELNPLRFCYRLRNDSGIPVGYNWDDNDFCSYGERREDGHTEQ